jgi:hypothetical protein
MADFDCQYAMPRKFDLSVVIDRHSGFLARIREAVPAALDRNRLRKSSI